MPKPLTKYFAPISLSLQESVANASSSPVSHPPTQSAGAAGCPWSWKDGASGRIPESTIPTTTPRPASCAGVFLPTTWAQRPFLPVSPRTSGEETVSSGRISSGTTASTAGSAERAAASSAVKVPAKPLRAVV